MLTCVSLLLAPLTAKIRVLRRAAGFISANTLFILVFHLFLSPCATRLLEPLPIESWLLRTLLISALTIALLTPFNLLILKAWPGMVGVTRRPTD